MLRLPPRACRHALTISSPNAVRGALRPAASPPCKWIRCASFRSQHYDPAETVTIPQERYQARRPGQSREPKGRHVPTHPWSRQVLGTHELGSFRREDFLSRVHYMPALESDDHTPTTVILISKQLAPWLSRDDTFVADILKKVWSHASSSKEVSVLTAVVDRLPQAPAPKIINEDMLKRVLETSSDPTSDYSRGEQYGLEGIAIFAASNRQTFDSKDTQPVEGVKSTPELHTRALKPDEQPPVINFRLISTTAGKSPLTVSVPVAQTLFLTGQPSTASFSRWTVTASECKKVWQGDSTKKTFNVNLPTHMKRADDHKPLIIKTPLLQLTGPRTIKSIMGNVIRELEPSHAISNEPMLPVAGSEGSSDTSASTELEQGVAAFMETDVAPDGLVGVWALIVPRDLTLTKEFNDLSKSTDLCLQKIRDSTSIPVVERLVRRGATLRRVLSGGGGWGNKTGLLSLDPLTDYSQPNAEPSFDIDGDNPMGFLNNVASSGDVIVFFAAADEKAPAPILDQAFKTSLVFGVVPADAAQVSKTQQPAKSSGDAEPVPPKILSFAKHFGALSETGLSISGNLLGMRSPTTDANARTEDDGSFQPRLETKSKLDIPGARIINRASLQRPVLPKGKASSPDEAKWRKYVPRKPQ